MASSSLLRALDTLKVSAFRPLGALGRMGNKRSLSAMKSVPKTSAVPDK